MASKRATTVRVSLSCSCRSPKAHHRYARGIDGLARATIQWYEQGGHDNPNHHPRIEVSAYKFVRDKKREDQLQRRLANRPPPVRRPTAEEALARPGTVLRRYGA